MYKSILDSVCLLRAQQSMVMMWRMVAHNKTSPKMLHTMMISSFEPRLYKGLCVCDEKRERERGREERKTDGGGKSERETGSMN